MKTFVALFRGINVGGHNVLPMKDLVSILQGLGLQNVRTYIQSGNAVFQASQRDASNLEAKIGSAIERSRGFRPNLILLDARQFCRAAADNPFRNAEGEPKKLHLYFLASTPSDPDIAGIERSRSNDERSALGDRVFYLYAPDGIGRSKLAARVEKLLGVAATARNWRTVCKLTEMLDTPG